MPFSQLPWKPNKKELQKSATKAGECREKKKRELKNRLRGKDGGREQGGFRWRGMETETKQRQDINQGNATAWQTANDTTRKQKKTRETEISVRGAAALLKGEGDLDYLKHFHCLFLCYE